MAVTYEPIASFNSLSGAASVSFTSIPSTYTDLVLVVSNSGNATRSPLVTFNNDTGTNYSVTRLIGDGSSAGSDRYTSQNFIYAAIVPSGSFSTCIINVMNYANTTTYKTALSRGSGASASVVATVGLWRSTNAINRIDYILNQDTFNAGSTATLYGIKAA